MSVAASAASEDERELLCALRDSIAEAIDDGVPARDLAALSKRLMDIRREISEVDAQREKDGGGVIETADDEWDGDY